MWNIKKVMNEKKGPMFWVALVLISIVALLGALIMFALTNVSRSWKEEVRLSDGSVIVVKRRTVRERFGELGHHGRVLKQEIEYDKPGGAVHWVGDIDPVIFDFGKDKTYLVAFLSTGEDCKAYGYPANPFIPYEYSVGVWRRIEMSNLPDALAVNLLLNAWNSGGGLITLPIKRREDFNLPDWFKKFDKNKAHPFNPCPKPEGSLNLQRAK